MVKASIWVYDRQGGWSEGADLIGVGKEGVSIDAQIRNSGYVPSFSYENDVASLELNIYRRDTSGAPYEFFVYVWDFNNGAVAYVHVTDFPSLLDVMQKLAPLIHLGIVADRDMLDRV